MISAISAPVADDANGNEAYALPRTQQRGRCPAHKQTQK